MKLTKQEWEVITKEEWEDLNDLVVILARRIDQLEEFFKDKPKPECDHSVGIKTAARTIVTFTYCPECGEKL